MALDIDKITAATFALRDKVAAIDSTLADASIPFVGDLLTAPVNGHAERLPDVVEAWKALVDNSVLDDDFSELNRLLVV